MPKARAAFGFSAVSQTCFWWGLPFTRAAPFMNRILRCSFWGGGLQFGRLRTSLLIFVDDVVLKASSVCDLWHSLDQFTAECEAAGMRISTSKSEAMALSMKPANCPLLVGNEFLTQVKEFKYHIHERGDYGAGDWPENWCGEDLCSLYCTAVTK